MRTIVITGANTGIGRATAEGLASADTRLILAGRSLKRTQPVIDAVRARGSHVEFIELDLANLAQTRAAARELQSQAPQIDVLLNNAGVAGVHGRTVDGFEMHFGVNHLGHFVWTMALIDQLVTNRTRIVTVASEAHRRSRGLDFAAFEQPTKTRFGWPEYCDSKLCNVLFTSELARRYSAQGITAVSLHPGVIASDLWRHVPSVLRWLTVFMRSSNDGAKTSIYCATAAIADNQNGAYFDNSKPRTPGRAARNETLANELWRRSETLV